MAKYNVIGAGSTSGNPVTVYHDCGVDTVQVCWTGRLSTSGKCEDMYFDEEYCDSVSVSPTETSSGHITWTNPTGGTHNIHYVSKLSNECPTPKPPCSAECLSITAYASPKYINDSGSTFIYYDTMIKCYGRVSGVKEESGITFGTAECVDIPVPVSDLDIPVPVSGCTGYVTVCKAEDNECTPGCKADLSVSVNREYVPASGTAISGSEITFRYKKVTTDDECRKKTTDGIFIYDDTLIVNISGCTSGASGSGKEYQCCHDHYVNMDIPVSGLSKYLSGCTVYYDGDVIVTSAGTIPYRILQKAKTSGECSGVCEERTTYCVESSSVTVCYEDGYLTNKWLCPDETTSGCDCTSLSISGFNGNYAVPYTGGRIKVTWDYSAHTITPNCTEFDVTGGTWEEIITVGGCDERPTSCDTKYNKITYHDEQGRSVETTYDDKTYGGCEKCDAECCYNYNGNGRCKCVILFKEQTPGCTTCDSCTVWDDDEKRNITYNKIRYEFVQDCNATCDSHTVTVYSAQTSTIECDYPGGDITVKVPFTSTTEYTGIGCPPNKTSADTIDVSKHIDPIKNTSHMDRVIYEDDMLRIVQKSGETCVESASCDCNDLTIDFPDTPTPPGPTPTDCNVKADTTLNGYVSDFNSTLGTTISVSNTPCTYKYLKLAYDTVSNENEQTIIWTLANVMSEITPKNTMCHDYFKAAISSKYGGIPKVNDNTKSIYENRINGGVKYALFKYNNYEVSKSMVANARAELKKKGIKAADWGSDNKKCHDQENPLCFWRNGIDTEAPNPVKPELLIPNMWGDKASDSYDYTSMAQLVKYYPTIESVRNLDLDVVEYTPLYDKQYCNMHMVKAMKLPETIEWANFINDVTDVAIASGNVAKIFKITHRPPNAKYNGKFNYLCDNSIEIPFRKECDDECCQRNAQGGCSEYIKPEDSRFCNCETTTFKTNTSSYPSGHSFKAFMALLTSLVVKGNSGEKIDRMTKYCYHRNVVRAHWHSDVLIGKLIATMDIGYLCGYEIFQEYVDELR